MAILANTQYERFAQSVASGANLTQAAIQAGYTSTTAPYTGSRIAKRSEVAERINELKSAASDRVKRDLERKATRVALTDDFVFNTLQDNAIEARQVADYSASNRAVELLARLRGMLVERAEVTQLDAGLADALADARARARAGDSVIELPAQATDSVESERAS